MFKSILLVLASLVRMFVVLAFVSDSGSGAKLGTASPDSPDRAPHDSDTGARSATPMMRWPAVPGLCRIRARIRDLSG